MRHMSSKKQKIILYSGNVQGVGFRYTACRVARNFDVTGYVENLPDGRVQCLIEGDSDEIAQFIETLADKMEDYIHEASISSGEATGQYFEFGIKC